MMGEKHTINIEPAWENMARYFFETAKRMSYADWQKQIQPILNGYSVLRKLMNKEITRQEFDEILDYNGVNKDE